MLKEIGSPVGGIPPAEFFGKVSPISNTAVFSSEPQVHAHPRFYSKKDIHVPLSGEEQIFPPITETPPLWVLKTGDLVHNAVYGALTGTSLARPFVDRCTTLTEFGRELDELQGDEPRRFPTLEDIILAGESAGRKAARFFAYRDSGKKVHNIIEPSFVPNPSKFIEASTDIQTSLSRRQLDPMLALVAAESFARTDVFVRQMDGLDPTTREHLRTFAGPATIIFDSDSETYHIVNQAIRPDILRISYDDTPENKDMGDLVGALDYVKRGPGVRRNLLDFTSWVDEPVPFQGGTIPGREVIERVLEKIYLGQASLSVTEIKNHINGHFYLKRDVRESNKRGRSPYVHMSEMHWKLRNDVGTTTLHLLNFATNFLPDLRQQEQLGKFLSHVHTEVIEVSLDMIQSDAHSTMDPYHFELRKPRPSVQIYQLTHGDLVNAWIRRRRNILRQDARIEQVKKAGV